MSNETILASLVVTALFVVAILFLVLPALTLKENAKHSANAKKTYFNKLEE